MQDLNKIVANYKVVINKINWFIGEIKIYEIQRYDAVVINEIYYNYLR